MQKHASKPYNPNIAHVFYLAGFIESWGRGVEKICHALKADNLPLPEYTIHPGDIMIKFTAPENRVVRLNKQITDNLSDNLSDKLSDKEQKTLELLLEDPGYTALQLAEKLHVSRVSVTKYLKALKQKGIIERIGSDRSGYWKIN